MNTDRRPQNVFALRDVLNAARKGGYAVGSFAPRYTPMIRARIKARSPLIVQVSQKEARRYGIGLKGFADAFYAALREENASAPVVLYLDHTRGFSFIEEAMRAGFTSVMVDASDKPLDENIALTGEVVEYARVRRVSVEGELGEIGASDSAETDGHRQAYTDPEQAERFVRETRVDALAVSVGMVHGVFANARPTIDYERLRTIRKRTPVPLVLHGGSGVPPEMLVKAIRLPGGGVSKVNVATDLEPSLLGALGRKERLTDAGCRARRRIWLRPVGPSRRP